MKFIKAFEELSNQEELYHYTSIENLKKILNSGELKVKPKNILNKFSRNLLDATDYGYISLTEDEDFHTKTTDVNTDVRIAFDRKILSTKFKLVPFSYDEEKYSSIDYDDDLSVANDEWYGDEGELRVYQNIPIRYIKHIDPIYEDIPEDLYNLITKLNISVREL